MPWTILRRSVADHVFVGILIVVPTLAFMNVCGRKLPVFFGLVEAGQKALLLLFLGKMQKELADNGSPAQHVPFKAADILETLVPQLFPNDRRRQFLRAQNLRMHAHYQYLFVIRPVKDSDVSTLGQTASRAPQKIMLQFRL